MQNFQHKFFTINLLNDYTCRFENLSKEEKTIDLNVWIEPNEEKKKEWKKILEKRSKPKGTEESWTEEEIDEYFFQGPVSANMIFNNKNKLSKRKLQFEEFQKEILYPFHICNVIDMDPIDITFFKGAINATFITTKPLKGEKLAIVIVETKTHFLTIIFFNAYSGYHEQPFWKMYTSFSFADLSQEEEERISLENKKREIEMKEYIEKEKELNEDYSSMIEFKDKLCIIKLLDYYQVEYKTKKDFELNYADLCLKISPKKEKLNEWEKIKHKKSHEYFGKHLNEIERIEEIEVISFGNPLTAELSLILKKDLKNMIDLDIFAEDRLKDEEYNQDTNKKIVMNGAKNALLIEAQRRKGFAFRDVFIFIETETHFGSIRIIEAYPGYQKEEFWKIFKSITFL